jgi:hypothetical protein
VRGLLKGLVALVLLLAVGWTVLNLWWGHELTQRLEALQASGQPLTVSEMMPPDFPDSQNAAVLYREAVDLPAAGLTNDALDYHKHNDPAHEQAAGTLLASPEAKQRLARAERAAALPACVWLPRLEGKDGEYWFSRTRSLVQLAALQSVWLARHGQPDEALHWTAVGIRMARHAGMYPTTVGLLVECADSAITLVPAQEVIGANRAGAAARQELAAALAAVDLNQVLAVALRRSMADRLERFEERRSGRGPSVDLRSSEVAEGMFAKAGLPGVGSALWRLYYSPLGRPLVALDEGTYIDLVPQAQAAAALPSAEGHRLLARMEPRLPRWRWLASGTTLALPEYVFAPLKRDAALANVDLCRLTLALQDYRESHGQYPDTLDKLSATDSRLHLTDPFSGKPYVYRREGPGFLVYSFGPDMVDDGGTPNVDEKGKYHETGDIVWRCAK